MSSPHPTTVSRRRVFYIPGYDPIHPRRYRELYRKEGAAQAAISDYTLTLTPAPKGRHYGWQVDARTDGALTHADIEVLVWSDIVRGSMEASIPGTYLQLARTAWTYITSGALRRLMRLRKGPVIAALAAFFLCMVLPILAVRLQRTQRINDLVRQLPDALDMMARGLKVGHPLQTSLSSVANEMPDPIGTEFGLVVDQVAFGDDLVDAFNEFADRLNQEDVHYLATAIAIQHGTGGDLARVLTTLSKVIRERLTMRRKVKAVSAEGRLSAAILSVVPVIIFVGLNVMSPSYYGDIADEPLAKPLVFAVIG